MSSKAKDYIVIIKSREAIFDITFRLHSQLGKSEWVKNIRIRIDRWILMSCRVEEGDDPTRRNNGPVGKDPFFDGQTVQML